MATDDSNRHSDRFQFRLRTLLLVVTAACVLWGFLHFIIPDSLSIELRIAVYAMFTIAFAFAVWRIHEAKRHPWKTPASFVTVKVDAKWQRRVKSPFILGPIAALTGVSLSFAPLLLVWRGQVETWGVADWIVIPLCFLIIYIVPGFYMRLASEVIAELAKSDTPSEDVTQNQ